MNIIIAFEVRAVESIMLLKGRIQFSSVRGYYVAWISVFNLILAVIRPLINNVFSSDQMGGHGKTFSNKFVTKNNR